MNDREEGDSELQKASFEAEYRVWTDDRELAEEIVRERFRDEIVPDGIDVSIETNNPGVMGGPGMNTHRYTFRVRADFK